MCGRYTQAHGARKLQEHFNGAMQKVLPRFNVTPTQNALVVHRESPRTIDQMRWGFVPSWSNESGAQLLINSSRPKSFNISTTEKVQSVNYSLFR